MLTQVDTARTYCEGTCEEYLGQIDTKGRGVKIETKLYPAKVSQSLEVQDSLLDFHRTGWPKAELSHIPQRRVTALAPYMVKRALYDAIFAGSAKVPRCVYEGFESRVGLILHSLGLSHSQQTIVSWRCGTSTARIVIPHSRIHSKASMICTRKGSSRDLGSQTICRASLSPPRLLVYQSNLFHRWEVAEIVGICKANGYIQPTSYQGRYNAIYR